MDYKRSVIANLVLSTLVGGHAMADSTHMITGGTHSWNNGMAVNNAPGWPGSGIRGEGGVDATINVHGDIDVNSNHSGMFLSTEASVNFISTDSTSWFSANNNSWEGFLVESSAALTIDGMNVSANKNKDNGLRVFTGGRTFITEASTLEFNDNGHKGIFAYNDGSATSVISITGKADGNSTLQANGNGEIGIQSEKNALLSIADVNVGIANNGTAGLRVMSGGQASISGDGTHSLTVTGNGINEYDGAGILVKDDSLLNIDGLNVSVKQNGPDGIRATGGSVINMTGTNTSLDIAENNNADKDRGNGILADSVGHTGLQSTINIKDMNITVSDQAYQGIAARAGGIINIISTAADNALNVFNTRMASDNGQDLGKGIHAKESSDKGQHAQINIKDMNINASGNELEGLVSAHSGVIYVTSTNGKNTLKANKNKKYISGDSSAWDYGAGLLAHGVSEHSPDKQATIVVENMSIEANNNGHYGLYTRDGGQIYITGDGTHTLDLIGNKSTVSHTFDAGIAVDGLHLAGTSEKRSTVGIENMQVTISDNGRYGMDITNGGKMWISSTNGNTLTISGNQTGDADNNEGAGINVAGMFGDTPSRLDIFDMNVHIDGSPDAGIKASDGGQVNIVSSMGNHTLTANNNDNHGHNDRYNQGTGLFAFNDPHASSSQAALNISGMNIEANNNGSYGVLSENSHVRLAGNGYHRLDVDGNGQYGILAKDGGSIEIAGMKVSGNSLDFSLVGIEREGSISLTNSVIATDNDTLFYTWSDEDTRTGQFSLKESIAIGNGTKLAWFDAHNSVLDASHSWLENAIGTNTEKGATSTVSLDHSTWLMKESSNITDLSISHSLTDMRKKEGHTTLTLGSLASDNSTYLLNTYFDAPGLSSDKIIVEGGDAIGKDNVLRVYSTGYAEDTRQINGYGIQVVNLDNATDKSVDFSLYGGVVDSGAYDYYLWRAVDDNYYLQTDYTPTTTAKAVTNIPAVHLSIVKSGLNEFRHRITELREYDIFHPNEVWVRSWGKHLKIDDTIESRMNLYGIEMGYDKEVHENEGNKYYAGIMAGYMYASNIKHHNAGYPDGSAKANTPGVGLYGVWDNSNGWYSYGTLRYFWSKMKAQNYSSAGEKITFNPDRNYFAATFELGKQYEDIVDDKSKWIIEPKAELGYARADSKSFKTNLDTRVHYGASESFTTRAALLLGYNSQAESGAVYEPFVELGVNREWLGKTDVTYAGAQFKSDQRGNGFDASVGLRAKTNEKWSFIGNLGYEKGEVTQGLGAQLGVRYSW